MRILELIPREVTGRNKDEFVVLENNRKDHFHLVHKEMREEARSKKATGSKIEQELPLSSSISSD